MQVRDVEVVYTTRISCPHCKDTIVVGFGKPITKTFPACLSCKKLIQRGLYKGVVQRCEVSIGKKITPLEEWETTIEL